TTTSRSHNENPRVSVLPSIDKAPPWILWLIRPLYDLLVAGAKGLDRASLVGALPWRVFFPRPGLSH
ncbi:MAG: hypothetical protein ACRERT_05860, partial [Pseudomonas sp.]